MIQRNIDEKDGIIFVAGSGQWSLSDVDEHYAELGKLVDHHRAAGLLIRVLVDVTHAERQTAAVEERSLYWMKQTFTAGDRVALLIADEDDRQHVRSVLGNAKVAAFVSGLAAEMWLVTPLELAQPQTAVLPSPNRKRSTVEMCVAMPRATRAFMWGTALGILAIPAIAMQVTAEIAWSPSDFAAAAAILLCICLGAELVYRFVARTVTRVVAVILVVACGALASLDAAVGLFELSLLGGN